nr:hypothetical protein [Candidatus Sigynarchaeota archaeon]
MESKSNVDIPVVLIVYTELLPEGPSPIAYISTKRAPQSTNVFNVALKSIALLTSDDVVPNPDVFKDPKVIVDESDAFGIIPYPDQDAVGMSYAFTYAKGEGAINCTLSILVPEAEKNYLFENHQSLRSVLKYTAYELLKILVSNDRKSIHGKLTIPLQNLLEKLYRLGGVLS